MATFLLVHGAGHDAWCWHLVAADLAAAGHRALAPDLPCEDPDVGLAGYVATCERALDTARLEGEPDDDVVVVGHSLGALTATVVAARRPVRRLALVAGIIGAPGRSLRDLAEADADRDVPLVDDDFEPDGVGRFRFTATGARRALYHDVAPELAGEAVGHLRWQRSLWEDVAAFDAWPATDIVSVVCRHDRIPRPAWSRRVTVERLGVEPVEVDGGHSPMLSRPAELAGLLSAGLAAPR